MIARHCTREDMWKALDAVNLHYDGNIEFNRFEPDRKKINFTLRVKSSKGPGHGIGHEGRRLVSACWHVHGDFFDELFNLAPDATVYSSRTGSKITKAEGNWKDFEVGSMMYPKQASEKCDCGPLRPTHKAPGCETFVMRQDMILKCPLCIMVPSHYKQDGSCYCFDKGEIAKRAAEKLKRKEMIKKVVERQKG